MSWLRKISHLLSLSSKISRAHTIMEFIDSKRLFKEDRTIQHAVISMYVEIHEDTKDLTPYIR